MNLRQKFMITVSLFLLLLLAMGGMLYYAVTRSANQFSHLVDHYTADHHIRGADLAFKRLRDTFGDYLITPSLEEKEDFFNDVSVLRSHLDEVPELNGLTIRQRRLLKQSYNLLQGVNNDAKRLFETPEVSEKNELIRKVYDDLHRIDKLLVRTHSINEEHLQVKSRIYEGDKARIRDIGLFFIAFALGSSVWVSWRFSKLVKDRVQRLNHAIQMLRWGQIVPSIEIGKSDEVGELINSFNRLSEDLQAAKEETRKHLEAKEKTLKKLITINHLVKAATELPLQDILDKTLDKFQEMPEAIFVAVHLEDDHGEGKTLSLRAERGLAPPLAEVIQKIEVGPGSYIGKVAETGNQILLSKQEEIKEFFQSLRIAKLLLDDLKSVKNIFCIPLIFNQAVLGVLTLGYKSDLMLEDISVIESIASNLGNAIRNAQLFEGQVQALSELSALHMVTDVRLSALDLMALLSNLIERVTRVLNMDAGFIFVYENNELEFKASYTDKKEALSKEYLQQVRLFAQNVFAMGKPFAVEDVTHSLLVTNGEKDNLEIVSLLSVPLKINDQIIGVTQVTNSESHKFNIQEVNLMEILAERVSSAIANTRLYQRFESLQQKYNSLLENTKDLVILTDQKGKMLLANKTVEEVTGYNQKELGKLTVADLFTPDTVKRIYDIVDSEESVSLEAEITKKNGERVFIKADIALLLEDDKLSAIQIIGQKSKEVSALRHRNLVEGA